MPTPHSQSGLGVLVVTSKAGSSDSNSSEGNDVKFFVPQWSDDWKPQHNSQGGAKAGTPASGEARQAPAALRWAACQGKNPIVL